MPPVFLALKDCKVHIGKAAMMAQMGITTPP